MNTNLIRIDFGIQTYGLLVDFVTTLTQKDFWDPKNCVLRGNMCEYGHFDDFALRATAAILALLEKWANTPSLNVSKLKSILGGISVTIFDVNLVVLASMRGI